jgi:hypothetical protein
MERAGGGCAMVLSGRWRVALVWRAASKRARTVLKRLTSATNCARVTICDTTILFERGARSRVGRYEARGAAFPRPFRRQTKPVFNHLLSSIRHVSPGSRLIVALCLLIGSRRCRPVLLGGAGRS